MYTPWQDSRSSYTFFFRINHNILRYFPQPQPKIRFRLPDGRYMTESDISQYQYVPPAVQTSPGPSPTKKQPRFTSIRGTPAPPIPRPKEPVPKDEAGVPIDWKTERLKEAAKVEKDVNFSPEVPTDWKPDRLRRARGNSDASDSSSVARDSRDNADEAAVSSILQMWRASLKQTSPYKFMDLDDLKRHLDEERMRERERQREEHSSMREFKEKTRSLRPTPKKPDGDDRSIVTGSVSQDFTMDSSVRPGSLNDGEVAVNDGWLSTHRKQLKPTPAPAARWKKSFDSLRQLGHALGPGQHDGEAVCNYSV
jgi:hypothetical protein